MHKKIKYVCCLLVCSTLLLSITGGANKVVQNDVSSSITCHDNHPNEQYVFLSIDKKADFELLEKMGLDYVGYSKHALVKADARTINLFKSLGNRIENLHDRTKLFLTAGVFDTAENKIMPDIPAELCTTSTDYYILQFIGPIHPDWLPIVEAYGVRFYDYIPNYAYLTMIPEAQLHRIADLKFVEAICPYQPFYKISPFLGANYANSENNLKVVILTFEPQFAGTVAAQLSKAGIAVIGVNTIGVGKVIASVKPSAIKDIAKIDYVAYIEPYYDMKLHNNKCQWLLQSAVANSRPIWDKGIAGENQVVGVADSGLDVNHYAFRDSTYAVRYSDPPGSLPPDSNHRKVVNYHVFSDRSDYYGGHGTHTSGTVAGNDEPFATDTRDGMAKNAKLSFADVMTGQQDVLDGIPDDLHDLFIVAYDDGARIHSNSWGGSVPDALGAAPYTSNSREADLFMWEHKDFQIFFSNGNWDAGAGRGRYVGSPATAKNVVSVGGCSNNLNGDVWDSSAIGPAKDGRLKPTVVTPYYLYSACGGTTSQYIGLTGTSMSSPAAAGVTALIRQYFTEGWYPTGTKISSNGFAPSAALLKATLINSAVEIFGIDSHEHPYNNGNGDMLFPNNDQGWGRPCLNTALYFTGETRKIAVVDDSWGLLTGDTKKYKFEINDVSEELKITLVWTDYPSSLAASRNLVNDLNLLVKSPAGLEYKGNVFVTSGTPHQSQTGGTFDSLNVEEQVLRFLSSGDAGTWTVEVIGTNIPKGPQPFALVVTGGINNDAGKIWLDKPVYGVNDLIGITVEDLNANSVDVMVSSNSQPTPITVSLTPTTANSGVWHGSLETAPTPTAGKLYVADRDTITAKYADVNPAIVKYANATVDANTPSISSVWVTDIDDHSATIHWVTTEPTDSKVTYGTTPSLGLTATDPWYTISHSVTITGLAENKLYYFDVTSKDRFGYTATDNNNGAHYTFTTVRRAPILLVDATKETYFCKDKYKAALEAHGWQYSVWDIGQAGIPSLSTLQEYYVVIWETGEKYPQVDAPERTLFTQYLDGGARFFVSSHDVGWDQGSTQTGTHPAITWYNSVMKARWLREPYTIGGLVGISGDPISGTYTGGISYTTLRSGGADDQIATVSAGGTGYYVWRDKDCFDQNGNPVAPDNVALRWVSNANNGTAGVGKWGGTPSRLVYFAFIFPQITDEVIRANILNNTLVWLIGRSPPKVDLISPVGGEIWSGTKRIRWSATGTNLDKFDVQYSSNGGLAWHNIATNLPSTTTYYDWNTSTVPDGYHYKIKVIARDNIGLSGEACSADNFTIRQGGLPSQIINFAETGWHLISINLVNTSDIGMQLSSIRNKYNKVEFYDASDTNDHWKIYDLSKPAYLNDLKTIDIKMGVWINITTAPARLVIFGIEPLETTITLYPGWNLVGYPSSAEQPVKTALSGLWQTHVTVVQAQDNTKPYALKTLTGNDYMTPGCGYWLYCVTTVDWNISW